jgi:hypothetical protein
MVTEQNKFFIGNQPCKYRVIIQCFRDSAIITINTGVNIKDGFTALNTNLFGTLGDLMSHDGEFLIMFIIILIPIHPHYWTYCIMNGYQPSEGVRAQICYSLENLFAPICTKEVTVLLDMPILPDCAHAGHCVMVLLCTSICFST